ncbi:sensor histidine kinase [Streptomyces sp. NBRC 109706]|uniref:ATP-binding protein n=1 Tax=Streptomyces sp. NBRC 109706 TaxID=1550035 RepID=UPI00078297EB|nr:sensor histidine kinase [Streptomyces sp. NBRC 109706]
MSGRLQRAADRLQATIDELLIEARGRARTLDRAPADLTALAWPRRYAGAGLGLPIAYQIAEAHGGRLTVASSGPCGDGCVFRLSPRR